MVEAHVDRRAALGRQALEAGDDAVGVDGTLHVGGQRLAVELVDDVQELELSVRRRSGRTGSRGPKPRSVGSGRTAPMALPMPRSGFLRLRRAHAGLLRPRGGGPACGSPSTRPPWRPGLLVASPSGDGGGEKSPRKARRASSSSVGTGAVRRWVDLGWPTTRQAPLGDPELRAEGRDGPPAAVRGQKFPRLSSLSMSLSRAWSATIFFRRGSPCAARAAWRRRPSCRRTGCASGARSTR